jgi:signal transduction histidine kinase
VSASRPGRRAWWRGIRGRLFISYLLVTGVGILTLFLAVSLLAPTLFDRSMTEMMGGSGTGGMMGGIGQAMTEAMSASIASSFRQALTSSLLLATLVGLIAAAVASYLFSTRIVEPVRRMARASRRVASGHYAERVPEGGTGELAELGESFNQMAGSLEEVERRRLALLGDVAHELRTPLATIRGYAEGLVDGVVEASPETFALLLREAGRLTRLVDDLQELSRAEARQLTLHPVPLPPKRLVESTVARLRPQFAEKELRLEVDLPEHLPDVLADEDRAAQVLTNLLGNALRYTPSGGEVVLRVRELADQVEFQVADTGIGIAPEDLSHLFERFYRADRSRSRGGGGSGVGLTIAKHLVEAQGGAIRAESLGLGKGTTFTFTLPTAR